ncbi:neuroligin protein binding [Mactra antiquata]
MDDVNKKVLFLLLVPILSVINISQALHFLKNYNTFAQFPQWDACINSSISFEFKTILPEALLMYTDDNGNYDYVEVMIFNSKVRLRMNIVDGHERSIEMVVGERVDDNKWHRVEIKRNRMETTLFVDKFHDSRVAFGSDFYFGNASTGNNYVYFGGLPRRYGNKLEKLSLSSAWHEERFNGDIRNVIYGNCSCIPVRASLIDGRSIDNRTQEACEKNNNCGKCLCISEDEGPGCQCVGFDCPQDVNTYYHLPMDVIEGDQILNPSGLDAKFTGSPHIVPAVLYTGMKLDCSRQYIKVSGPGHRYECFGDLSLCPDGYTIGMWFKFDRLGTGKGVYLSNGGHSTRSHGVAMYYQSGSMEWVFRLKNGREWRATALNVFGRRWYHVTVTWHKLRGVSIYLNGYKTAQGLTPTYRAPINSSISFDDFIIGQSNNHEETRDLGMMTVDDFQFWSYTLEETDLMEKGPIYHYHLSMDQLQNGYLVVPTLEPRTRGLLQQVPGIIGNAVEIPGRGQYIDLGSFTDTCLGNTTLCIYGFTVTFWVKFNRLQDNTYFMTSSVSGFSLFSYGNRLYANVQYGDRQYQATISGIETDIWYFLEITWNPSSGLELFKDQTLVASQTASNHYQVKSTNHDNFYIGRANTVMYTEKYAAITIDDLHLYNAGLELLLKIGFIQRGKPIKHYYGFDAMSGSRIEHPITDIQTEGNPSLVPGKINKALRLNGRSQSAYFDNGDGCLGNLDFCPHGVLLAFWFRPENSTEGMTYLSTGINGIEISNNGREFRTKVANSVYMWEVITAMMEPNMWYYVEVTWSEEAGLHLFINNKDVVTDTKPSEIDSRIATSGATDDMFVLGKGNKAGSVYGAATYDEMEFWYNTRGYLMAFGYIQRGKPDHFTIRMDKIIDDGKQLENDDFIVKIFGRPLLVPGKIDAALKLNGNTQFIDLGEHGDSCLGNLEECGFGLSIFFWAKIENYNYYMYLLSTGSAGIKMYYLHNYIFITIDNNRKSWRLSAPKVSQDEWHFFELSWHPEFGLSLFIDNDLIDHVTSISIPEVSATGSEHFYIGSPNTEDIRGQRFSYADMAIDQLEIWYGRREELLAFDYIVREQGAELSTGKVGQGISLDGTGQFVDLGEHMDKCFANIDVCNHGLTVSFWLKPRSSRTDQYFFSTPTYSIYSEDGLLKAKFVTSGKVWNVTSGGIRLDKWNNVMVSWDPEVGVKLFVDDRLLNNSQEPTDVMLSDQPTAGKVYIGKSSDPSIQQTANIQADEIQIWYADIDRLTAHGKYKIPLREEIALSEMPSSGVLKLPSRTVTLKGGATVVSEKDGNSVRLNGRAQFIDMGENLTCAGDLDRCPLGFTMRFVIKPERVLNNMYFLDSYPVSVFYRDGNMYATIRTSTKTWSVGAPGLKTGEWQTVDISWHPEVGLTMFVNDKEVGAHKTHGIKIEPVYDYDRRTFFGRAMTNMRNERYADTSVRNFEVINTRRDVLVANNQLNDGDGINYPVRPTGPQIYTTPKPGGDDTKTRDTVVLTSNPQTGNGQSSFGSQAGRTLSSTTSKIIQFVGKSYVIYDLNVLTDDMLVAANEEEFSFQFVTKQADGLMWVFNSTDQKLYVGLKDSSLVFGYIVGQNRAQTFRIDHPDSRALNDLKWHTIKIVKNGRTLKFYVDGRYVQEIVTRNLIQFMRLGDVYIGGVTNPREFTGGIITEKFDGAITDVDSKKTVGPKREYVISFLQNIETAQTIGNILIFDRGSWNISLIESTRPPPVTPAPDLSTPITFTSGASALYLQEALDMRKSGSIGFKFRTLEPRGLLVFARGSSQGVTFFAIEIFDGNLYLVYDLGSLTSRKTFTDRRVDDGEWHEVLMKVQNGQLVLTLDRIQFVINLSRQDAERLYFYRVYIGGFNDFRYNSIPWSIYSRQGYKGCLETLKINNIGVDLQVEVRRSRPQYVELGCSSVSRSCQTQPCVSGACRDRMNGYVCDCANTPYTGDTCNEDAVIGGWDGSFATTYDFPIREMTHTNDISFRFRTLMKDTILFRSEADNGRDFIRVELINGKVQMTISVDGNTKTFSSGNNLNDDLWHTLYFRRRADDVELWVDDERPTVGLIGGENYQLQIDKIKFGAVGDTGALKTNNYIGYLQNFIYEDTDLFQLLKSQNPNHKWIIDLPYNKLPLLTYKPVTITTSDAFFQLPSLRMGITMKLMFKFKTRESNGLILYNAGSGRDVIAVELSDGQIRLAYNLGGQNMFTMVPSLKKFNDNKWHTVVVTLNERGQFILKVDSDTTTASTSDADGRLDLSGSLYVGGLPSEMFKRSSVTNLIVSRNGFRGCLASVDLNGSAPDLINYARDPSTVLNGCTDLAMVCQPDVCGTGTCMPGINNYWCNCNMTGYVGSSCTDWPVGYYFGRNGANGVMIYEFPFEKQSNSDVDEIAFGFMTREKDGVLYRIESSLNSNEFIEISLDDGFVKADSNTGNGLVSITQNSKRFNDGLYHVVRYVRTGTNSSLQVDTLPAQIIPHSGGVSVFNKVYRVILGGRTDDKGAIIRNYYGIMGGAYYNGNRWFDMLLAGKNLHGNLVKLRGDVTLTKPFVLVSGARKTTAAPPDIVIPPDEVIPEGIGGGGFVVGSISGGDGGGAGVIGIGGPGGSLTPVGGVSVAGGPGTPLAVAGVGPAPPALAGGARAGAVVGTLLGTLAFMSSLMWALYKLKPGVPAILSPGAGAAGGGAGMSISAPRATSNLGAVQAASGGAGGGGAGAGGGASKVTVVNGSAAGGGAGGGSSTYTSYFQSTSTNVQGGGAGGAGGAGSGSAMAGGHADAIDSSTLRATGTFSNKGTAIGSPTTKRAHLGSSSTGYSSNYQSNAANYQSNTMQSYGSSMGGGTMDRGYGDRQFMSLSSAGGGDNIPDYDMPMPGTLQSQSGHNYSSSTLNTHYNYQHLMKWKDDSS